MVRSLLFAPVMAATLCANAWANDALGIQKVDPLKLDPQLLESVKAISQKAQSSANSIRNTEQLEWMENLSKNAVIQEAQRKIEASNLVDQGEKLAAEQKKIHPLGDGTHNLIFVSWSMGEASIKDILKLYQGTPATGVVFRGIPDGMSMTDAMLKMQMLTQDTQSDVGVLLDPMAFRRYSIHAVPAVVIETGEQKLIAKVTGLDSITYVEEAIVDGKQGDLGVVGNPVEIAEPDMLEVAKARIEALDYDAMKKRAISRFWKTQTGTPLPTATESKKRSVDPTVIIPADILDAEGRVVTKAGRINPLDIMPFNQKLVIIDPTQEWQVALAKREMADTANGLTITVMATQIPYDRGWDLFNDVQNNIDAPLYVLPKDLAARFQVERVPSIVTGDDKYFYVSEIAQPDAEEMQNAGEN